MNTRTHKKSFLLRELAIVLVAFITGCSAEAPDSQWIVIGGETMGTTYSVKLNGRKLGPKRLQSDIDALLDSINARLSTYQPDSELSRFNASRSTDWMEVSPELFEVIGMALEISEVTDGAFDATVAPLVELWSFGATLANQSVPPDDAIETALAGVDYTALHMDASLPAIRKDAPNLQVDLSAIAKGYAVDRIAGYLDSLKIEHYLVEIGGELKVKGRNARGNDWAVAIEQPILEARRVQRVVKIKSGAVATSGDYRNFFEVDGQRYSHIIDPHTGKTAGRETASVTVLAPSAMQADALATGLMVMGMPKGYELAIEQGIPAMFIVRRKNGFEEHATPEFEVDLGSSTK
jgi:thiamine biosynthesis lipoprotein